MESDIIEMNQPVENKRIETQSEVLTYLHRLKYALQSGSVKLSFLKDRRVDQNREKKHTNRYTLAHLFPNEDEVESLKRELQLLTIEDYIETVEDTRFPKLSEMRVFGKQYSGNDVYIKIRVELISVLTSGDHFILVMSFHYSEFALIDGDFPYKKVRGEKNDNNQ